LFIASLGPDPFAAYNKAPNRCLMANRVKSPWPCGLSGSIWPISLHCSGCIALPPKGSFIPGLEFAGQEQTVGTGVHTLKPGDPVMGVTRFGAWASHLTVDHRYVRPLSPGWSFQAGAAYPVQALTAYDALCTLGHLQPHQTVLIHSAAGGVGLWANRIAKHFDAFTVGTIGHADKWAVLDEEGYDRGIVRGRDFPRQLAEALEGRPLDLVLECIGGRILKASLRQLASRGRLVVYGAARYASPGSRPAYWKLLWHYLRRPRLDIEALIIDGKYTDRFAVSPPMSESGITLMFNETTP
jgi:NADPH:quinone reductase-like Zn-dependent oxidoreductase